ncbi:hypothetical protein PIB30_041861 [Stylosanthes scabra]|uniref:Aminotransferase-like plant mobile domain-containing protein n=1 Tax=Stylosanthes scabra TaxID=79078 RepID=A0ABU6UH40_9FABA|nr:hypothetical protein [Stylosanthes scabra]
MLKELVNIYDIHDNTIHFVRGDVEITTDKIGKALGLSWNGEPFDNKVSENDLNNEDHAIFKMFQGKSQAELTMLVKRTPVDTEANWNLFKRAFFIFIQKVFLLPTSSPNVTPKALPTLFGLENTRGRNWALHVHHFLLEEIKKAKLNNTKAVHGCCYVMMIIYFHETHFGKNSREPEAQPPWIQFWIRENLIKRLHREQNHPTTHPSPQPHPERTPNDNTNAETPAIDDSEDENQPPPPQFKIPKTEEAEEAQPAKEAQPQQSQTVVEVV